ncbi:MAG: hypothetical protein IPI97_14765 [Nitrosomonas sp.]|nr:hypothetical protein [Nitrosomonas sp.]
MFHAMDLSLYKIDYKPPVKSSGYIFSVEDVRRIRELRKQGYTIREIAKEYGCVVDTVRSVFRWVTYSHIDPHLKDEYLKSYGLKEKLCESDVRMIRDMRASGVSVREIARKYKAQPLTISNITKWVVFADIDSHLKDQYLQAYKETGHESKMYRIDEETAKRIVDMRVNGVTFRAIAEIINLPIYVVKESCTLKRKECRHIFEKYQHLLKKK